MSRKPSRAERPAQAQPAARRDQQRRARTEIEFDEPTVLGTLFGQFDANLVHIENRLGVYISARGNKVQIEGPEDAVARARDPRIASPVKKKSLPISVLPWNFRWCGLLLRRPSRPSCGRRTRSWTLRCIRRPLHRE